MAGKYTPQDEPSAAEQAAEDLTVLFPEVTIPIGGKTITVQEYSFMKWLELKPICEPVFEDFAEFIDRKDDILNDEILECFENNFQIMQTLYCESIQQDVEFLSTLKDTEMQILMITWWGVNKHFFIKSAKRLLRTKQKHATDGQTSSSA